MFNRLKDRGIRAVPSVGSISAASVSTPAPRFSAALLGRLESTEPLALLSEAERKSLREFTAAAERARLESEAQAELLTLA